MNQNFKMYTQSNIILWYLSKHTKKGCSGKYGASFLKLWTCNLKIFLIPGFLKLVYL